MRRWSAVGLLCLLGACSGMEGVAPPQMGANEMQPRPGLFSGPYGEFVLVGPETAAPEGALVPEVGAGT